MKSKPSKKALWASQLNEWPDSIRIYNNAMIDWIINAPEEMQSRLWMRLDTHMKENPHGVYYRTSAKPDAWVGFRFGVWCSDYSSGWPRYNYANG
jgi:hypothetical protein